MKSVPANILVISILALAVLGFLSMDHEGAHGAEGCLALAMRGTDCLQLMNPVELASLHLAALKSFSTALVYMAAVFAVFQALFWSSRRMAASYFTDGSGYGIGRAAFVENDLNMPARKITRWLAFHELSPALI